MDCWMGRVDGGEMAWTHINLVEWDGRVIMDEFVKTDKTIIDCLTPYSDLI